MATVTFTVSTAYLARMRTAIQTEQPNLVGQTVTVINEAARIKVRQLIEEWIFQREQSAAAEAALAAVTKPTETDIA